MRRRSSVVRDAGVCGGFRTARSLPEASVLFFDASVEAARAAAARVNRLVGRNAAVGRGLYVDESGESLRRAVDGCRAVFSALPDFLNAAAAEAAVDVGAHFCDLGGNTAVVRRELASASRAAARGVCVVPDWRLGLRVWRIRRRPASSRRWTLRAR
jgi:saccharopine dehydrogenase-like NADP-dependent oxidoreductase